jgi:hypothetical protein
MGCNGIADVRWLREGYGYEGTNFKTYESIFFPLFRVFFLKSWFPWCESRVLSVHSVTLAAYSVIEHVNNLVSYGTDWVYRATAYEVLRSAHII